jgi:uncharacterized protein YcgL (UPF0745 family)
MNPSLPCFVYKSLKRDATYLFIPEKDNFESLPPELRHGLGQLEFVMQLELTPERKLARTLGKTVMEQIARQGFYLQLPPKDNHGLA